jgi:hypothetical protein
LCLELAALGKYSQALHPTQKAEKFVKDHTKSLQAENKGLEMQLKSRIVHTQALIARKRELEEEARRLALESHIRDDLILGRLKVMQRARADAVAAAAQAHAVAVARKRAVMQGTLVANVPEPCVAKGECQNAELLTRIQGKQRQHLAATPANDNATTPSSNGTLPACKPRVRSLMDRAGPRPTAQMQMDLGTGLVVVEQSQAEREAHQHAAAAAAANASLPQWAEVEWSSDDDEFLGSPS